VDLGYQLHANTRRGAVLLFGLSLLTRGRLYELVKFKSYSLLRKVSDFIGAPLSEWSTNGARLGGLDRLEIGKL
jgi:hypothetical protein